MAIQKKTKNDFLSRSDALAAKLGCKIEELTQVFDVSRATLYAYRSGARDPSGKVLARLSQKETELDLPRPVESVSSEPPIIRPCYIPDSLIDKCENMLESLKKGQAITAEVLWEAIKEDVTNSQTLHPTQNYRKNRSRRRPEKPPT
jgi:transcriptional regulator with XRE-family HTH domain